MSTETTPRQSPSSRRCVMRSEIAAVDALLLRFGEAIDPAVSDHILALYRVLKSAQITGFIEIIPAYTTLYIQFDPRRYTHEAVTSIVQEYEARIDREPTTPAPRTLTIPVYYDTEVGWDLERVADAQGLSIEEVIALHSSRTYRVYMIGFMPGFGYMGEVDERIATPRLATPRTDIPARSVAIANTQCAIYPMASPGGWNIIGRTPLELFDPSLEGFSLLRPGDQVTFEPIDRERFLELGGVL